MKKINCNCLVWSILLLLNVVATHLSALETVQPEIRRLDEDKIAKVAKLAKLDIGELAPVSAIEGFYFSGKLIFFEFAGDKIEFDRQYDVVEDVFALDESGRKSSAFLRQTPHRWTVSRTDKSAVIGVIRFQNKYIHHDSAPTIKVEPRSVRQVELTAVILLLVASNRGVAVLPDWVVREVRYHSDYVTRPLTETGVTKRLYAAIRSDDRAKPFMSHLLKIARKIPVQMQRTA